MTLQTFAPARFAVVVMSIVVATIVSPVTDAAQQSGVNQPIFRAVPLEQRSHFFLRWLFNSKRLRVGARA